MTETSLCDTCPDPGHCCRAFPIHHGQLDTLATPLEVMVLLAGWFYETPDGGYAIGLPFVPAWYDTTRDAWRFNCIELQPDGRCGNYAHRPYGPCVIYEPGSDPLCVVYPRVLADDGTWEPKKAPDQGSSSSSSGMI